ncbi:biotin/lipoyl-binding protein [Microbulbifer thermotolerans]|uniref:Biotin/lipoyl-binding protein n=1 Tax=Microbulbifer thermotolerans TaxID=252514 RepID=A0AB35I1C7_MICTH|nr:biotin/lipoyl-binding protein [Microbulbifer thermotolerans]MCX2781228.1 biotin/lipoyl-binding protein [Microbulbifer thermotolerans]MCX2783420.1 biotin/lipoyl-binding protein [Microbulbifer thermotolerans]MCX2793455.1 biotin/lipoyl-binding protein [Microbulbifer thermotolerans]MCX2802894.1 biotin/lipoyl-binding protein [Microbulbifer thermotolerans]MCX2803743.1 biotin/lipoyl-binding protein [Microbulbifer thermotolerans]
MMSSILRHFVSSCGRWSSFLYVVVLCGLLSGCETKPDSALGTLEWNRIALPAPAAEKIVAIEVREGQRVSAGQVLLRLDDRRTRAQLAAAQAEVARNEALLEELQVGPRIEEIQRAEASLAAAVAEEKDARQNYRRLLALGTRDYISQADIDRAEAAADSASAGVDSARAALLELQRGTRSEEIVQAQEALAQARAEAEAQSVLLQKLTVQAPRAGLVDTLPFKLGDEAPVGGPLAIMLVGEAPYARVYIPQPLRPGIQVGDPAWVYIDGVEQRFAGRVRMIRSEPSFTPYYALTGDDVARLSYLAEIQLGEDAADFSAGLPLWAAFTQYEEGADDK